MTLQMSILQICTDQDDIMTQLSGNRNDVFKGSTIQFLIDPDEMDPSSISARVEFLSTRAVDRTSPEIKMSDYQDQTLEYISCS